MTFKAGETSNPEGKNGHLTGYQRYSDRVVFLQEKYTIGELIDIANSPDKYRSLGVRDGQIIRHLVNTVMGEDMRLEREALLDRIEGKPMQHIDTRNTHSFTVMPTVKIDGSEATFEVGEPVTLDLD